MRASKLKFAAKTTAIRVALLVGKHLPTAALRRFLCDRVAPYLMDPEVLPRGLELRPLRRFPVSVPCDPYLYVHRNGFWCGVFFEEEVEAYMLRSIKTGDTVIDVGMNVGHVTLPAGTLVGPLGQVLAFEPNPELAARVSQLAANFGLPQIRVHPCGLGAKDGRFTLTMEPDHTGGASFRERAASEKSQLHQLSCDVRVGDAVLSSCAFSGKVFLKIDVEGFEIEVLRGMKETLSRVDHAIIEVSPEWLGRAEVDELFAMCTAAGLKAHAVEVSGRVGRQLCAADIARQENVLFIRQARTGPRRVE